MDQIILDENYTIDLGDNRALILTKNNCANCDATKSMMDELGLSYITVNMDEKPEAKIAVKKMGYRQAPVVITRDAKWSGTNERAIRNLAQADDIWS